LIVLSSSVIRKVLVGEISDNADGTEQCQIPTEVLVENILLKVETITLASSAAIKVTQ